MDPTTGIEARQLRGAALASALFDAQQRTWAVLADLTAAQWQVPYDPGINPPRWEFGHVAWFTEWWVLREAHWLGADEIVTRRASMLPRADEWFDSGKVAHAARWTLDLPPLSELRDYAKAVLEGVHERVVADDARSLYYARLALFHEDMHAEALTYMRQTLGYGEPFPLRMPTDRNGEGDVAIPGGTFVLGSAPDDGFVFDNEKWAHPIDLAPARMARRCVTNAEYAAFVAAGGYREPRWWGADGRAWLDTTRAGHPMRWRPSAECWEQRWFGTWQPLAPDQPACHVNAFEAEAYCRWAGRRLPSEPEWEYAATHQLIEWGDAVWEWTADAFVPYPGFAADPYRDYSEPWFGTHRSVRGGSLVTRPRMHHSRYRNFYLPHRNDIFAGFRTCAVP